MVILLHPIQSRRENRRNDFPRQGWIFNANRLGVETRTRALFRMRLANQIEDEGGEWPVTDTIGR
jgi:hypothetical protein